MPVNLESSAVATGMEDVNFHSNPKERQCQKIFIGLIQPERNPENRYRNYTEEDVRRLNSIAFCRSMGISVSAIRRLLAGEVTLQSCVEDALLDARAAEAEARRTA